MAAGALDQSIPHAATSEPHAMLAYSSRMNDTAAAGRRMVEAAAPQATIIAAADSDDVDMAQQPNSDTSPPEGQAERDSRAPRVGHKKSRKGCAQCKRRHVKCNEEKPCSNCVRHGVACSLAGGPNVPRDDAKPRRSPTDPSSSLSRQTSHDAQSSSYATSNPTSSPGAESSQDGAIRRLTGPIDRSSHGVSDQNQMLDLQLMHHFMAESQEMFTDFPEMRDVWRQEIPRLAFRFPYLLHAVLSLSAVHMSHTQPETAATLRSSAVSHLDKSLVLYREDTTSASLDNADARFCFTWILPLLAYAIPPTLPPIDAMIELMALVKGVEVCVRDTFLWVAQGPFAPMLSSDLQQRLVPDPAQEPSMGPGLGAFGFTQSMGTADNTTTDTSWSNQFVDINPLPEGMSFGLQHLDFMLGLHVLPPDERRTCMMFLAELKQVYSDVLHGRVESYLVKIMCFPKQDHVLFCNLLHRRVPQALVILAHYTVAVELLETRWWMRGWAAGVLRDIDANLDDRWKSWIDWPVQTVLLKEETGETQPATIVPAELDDGMDVM